ncbi:MAG: hypothetical protein PF636_08125 [Actinomycetota bacterium]|jgi:NAD/NADP transhydrogenase beta subunit|nr:hypothetical protein [Actinomycetota bacterium]
MELADIGKYYDYMRYAVVAIVALFAVIVAVKRSKSRTARSDLIRGIIGIAVVVGMGAVAPATSWPLVAILLVVGVALGFALGGIRPLAAWIAMPMYVFAVIMLLWDQGGAFAVGLAVLALGAAIPIGQGVRGGRTSTAEPAVAPETS